MKSRIIPISLAFLTLAIATSLVYQGEKRQSAASGKPAAVSVSTKKSHRESRKHVRPETDAMPTETAIAPMEREQEDDSANLNAWSDQFNGLMASGETRENAAAIIAELVNRTFLAWVEQEIAIVESLDSQERLDRLTLAETKVKEGAAAVYEQLELQGGRRIEVAAEAMDALAAEIQYAEAAPDHKARLAMLHIDRERDARMNEAYAMTDESAKTRAMSELDQWYETRVNGLFPADPIDE